MGKTIDECDVFIASPGDVKEERQVVHDVCRDLKDDILEDNIQFKAVGWEDALPGAGRPQDIINHLVDGCDIFVCIFHKRFGSPTGEEESGTLEEILRAYDCWKGKKKPHIMIYFKDVTIQSIVDLNDDQLKRVLEFKDEIEKNRMFLYDTFKEKDQFRVMLKKHMKAWIKKNLSSGKLPPGRSKRSPSPDEKICLFKRICG